MSNRSAPIISHTGFVAGGSFEAGSTGLWKSPSLSFSTSTTSNALPFRVTEPTIAVARYAPRESRPALRNRFSAYGRRETPAAELYPTLNSNVPE